MNTKPTLHLIAPFHTVPAARFSHCAFTGKALRFAKMMVEVGYQVVEYANAGSEAMATEHVEMLSADQCVQLYPPLKPGESIARDAVIGSQGWNAFSARLCYEMEKRVRPHDIICHVFGRTHADLLQRFPQAIHVETGIGYEDAPFGAWRIFESEAWRHYHWGREDKEFAGNNGLNRSYSWVIPNYFEAAEWPYEHNPERGYILYMNRIHPCKGLITCADIIKAWDARHPKDGLLFKFAGQGDFGELHRALGDELTGKRTQYMGSVEGMVRAKLTGNALALLMPTVFTEPFGGAGIEGMLTGAPLLASDWGAFTETITTGVNGFRCKVLADWIRAIEWARTVDGPKRHNISVNAHQRYTLATCGMMYDRAFRQLGHIYGGSHKGWYDLSDLDPGPSATQEGE